MVWHCVDMFFQQQASIAKSAERISLVRTEWKSLQCLILIWIDLFPTGLITTTSRRLDREQQDEHILEVNYLNINHSFMWKSFS